MYGKGDESEQDALAPVVAARGDLVGRLLQGDELWGTHRWVDGITLSEPATLAKPGHIELGGLLVFGDTGKYSKEWWEPFYGSVQISETSDEIVSYELMFGDAARGLGNVEYNEHPRGWNWSRPEKWIFVFKR